MRSVLRGGCTFARCTGRQGNPAEGERARALSLCGGVFLAYGVVVEIQFVSEVPIATFLS